MLGWIDIETNAIAFAKRWKDCEGNERQEAQSFEKDLMSVFGVDWLEGLHEYQVYDAEGKMGYIDYLLPGKILIEMKSKGESLIRAYNQGYDYAKCLKPEEYPELLLVSDFEYIQVTNLKSMKTFKKFKLNQLKKNIRMLGTLAGYNSEVTFKTDVEVNIDASYKMAKLHDALKDSGYVGEDLEQYLVRLLFCMFAEDTGIFEEKAFENYVMDSREDGSDLSARIVMLFETLNTSEQARMTTLPEELKRFRYINGRLFEKTLPTAYFDSKMRKTLIDCCDFDWSYISPAIFGAMFQGVMDEDRRREMGAHYTDEENIMKVIKPLFLNELWEEFEKSKSTKAELEAFHSKLSTLKFLDPACGCGNFLIITYRELRLLEFEVLKMLHDNKQMAIIDTFCKISIGQFYGLEYEEFPSYIAQVAMLLMKHQMDKLVSNYFGMNIIDFPIKETANIIHGNALQIDWEEVVSKDELSYILGNPPFLGSSYQNSQQKEDMSAIFGKKFKGIGKLDYVTAWYKKTAELIQYTSIKAAFVSTNSIVQGEQVPILWKPLFDEYSININFAYRPFIWTNEARGKASVHCVIVGFSYGINRKPKLIFDSNTTCESENINAYLVNAPDVFIESKTKPLLDIPKMTRGSSAFDDGNLILSEEEKNEIYLKDEESAKFIKPYIGAYEFINNKPRWCLWLHGVNPKEIQGKRWILERIKAVKEFRLKSKRPGTVKASETPSLFIEIKQPNENYILMPRVSSERRKYVPIGFLSKDIIASDAVLIIPGANLYHFGVLTSKVHMAWMRAVAGRLKSDYRYSANIVYNNFPWPEDISDKQKESIEKTAQEVLDARALYPESSLADLYDPLLMPSELIKAHNKLDKAVIDAYGGAGFKSEAERVADLMQRYERLTQKTTK